MYKSHQIGVDGEQAAVEYLCGMGFELLHRNWRYGRYELDVVVRKDGVIHFVEVKTRCPGSLTSPEDAITQVKFAALTRAARAYIIRYGVQEEVQFDLVAVQHPDIRYVPNAMVFRW